MKRGVSEKPAGTMQENLRWLAGDPDHSPGFMRRVAGRLDELEARAEKAGAEIERLKKQCEGLAQAALNNGQDLLLHEGKVRRLQEALEWYANPYNIDRGFRARQALKKEGPPEGSPESG